MPGNAHLEILLLLSPLISVCNGIGVSGACSVGSYNDNGFCMSLIFMDEILRIQTGKIIVVGNTTIDSQSYIGIATNIVVLALSVKFIAAVPAITPTY